jgi:hypothetical protein
MAAVAMPAVTNANRKVLKIVVLIGLISSLLLQTGASMSNFVPSVSGEAENDTYG